MHGWWSSDGCDSFRDETDGDIKTSGNNVRVLSNGDVTYGDVFSLYPLSRHRWRNCRVQGTGVGAFAYKVQEEE
jgi:hypothetical protein